MKALISQVIRFWCGLFAMPIPDDHLPVMRHRLTHAEIFEVFGDELDRIEQEATNVGTDLQFCTFWLAIAIPSALALPTIPADKERVYFAFFVSSFLGFALGVYFGIRWWNQRGSLKRLLDKIRDRQIGPMGDAGNPLALSDVVGLPAAQPVPLEVAVADTLTLAAEATTSATDPTAQTE